MNDDPIPFDALQTVLLDLGFVKALVPGPYLLFEHPPTGTLLPYRAYQPGDNASWADLVMTRRLLDERGILEERAFEALLEEAPV